MSKGYGTILCILNFSLGLLLTMNNINSSGIGVGTLVGAVPQARSYNSVTIAKKALLISHR